jgi:hypothetical protein
MNIDPIWALTIVYVVAIAGITWVITVVLKSVKPEYGATLRDVFRQTRFLELSTVLVIIISASYLGWAGKLTDGLIALLTGIGAYVLGGLKDTKAADSSRQQQSPPAR